MKRLDGVVKTIHLLGCCKFHLHLDVLQYAAMKVKFTRLEHGAFNVTIHILIVLGVEPLQFYLGRLCHQEKISITRKNATSLKRFREI